MKMVLVANAKKPFIYNMKGHPRRKALETLYFEEIDRLYAEVGATGDLDIIPPPSSWDAESTAHFLRAVIENVLHQTLTDEEDIFQRGCDRYVGIHRVSANSFVDDASQTVCRQLGYTTLFFVLFVGHVRALCSACP